MHWNWNNEKEYGLRIYALVNFSNEWRENVVVILSPVHSANYGAMHSKSQKVISDHTGVELGCYNAEYHHLMFLDLGFACWNTCNTKQIAKGVFLL